MWKTKEIAKAYYKEYNLKRREQLNQYMKERQATPEGLLKRIYATQLYHSRKRGHEKPQYSWQQLVERYVNDPTYIQLHKAWIEGGKSRWNKPSLDRIDNAKGYSFDNIVLTTWQENFSRQHEDRRKKIYVFDELGNFIFKIHGAKKAMETLKIDINLYLNTGKITKQGYFLSTSQDQCFMIHVQAHGMAPAISDAEAEALFARFA